MVVLPFIIELFADHFLILKGKKDLHWGVRIVMMFLVSITALSAQAITISTSKLMACFILYPFFDIALNILCKRNWAYLGRTKYWDITLGKIDTKRLLIIRFVLVVAFTWLTFQLR